MRQIRNYPSILFFSLHSQQRLCNRTAHSFFDFYSEARVLFTHTPAALPLFTTVWYWYQFSRTEPQWSLGSSADFNLVWCHTGIEGTIQEAGVEVYLLRWRGCLDFALFSTPTLCSKLLVRYYWATSLRFMIPFRGTYPRGLMSFGSLWWNPSTLGVSIQMRVWTLAHIFDFRPMSCSLCIVDAADCF